MECGKCLASDCRGFEGYTDPNCPDHGINTLGITHCANDGSKCIEFPHRRDCVCRCHSIDKDIM